MNPTKAPKHSRLEMCWKMRLPSAGRLFTRVFLVVVIDNCEAPSRSRRPQLLQGILLYSWRCDWLSSSSAGWELRPDSVLTPRFTFVTGQCSLALATRSNQIFHPGKHYPLKSVSMDKNSYLTHETHSCLPRIRANHTACWSFTLHYDAAPCSRQ
jgi:hypothetical protein